MTWPISLTQRGRHLYVKDLLAATHFWIQSLLYSLYRGIKVCHHSCPYRAGAAWRAERAGLQVIQGYLLRGAPTGPDCDFSCNPVKTLKMLPGLGRPAPLRER